MPNTASRGVSGRTVVVAGATSAAGLAVVRALASAGARVVATGRSKERLADLAAQVPGIRIEARDATVEADMTELANQLVTEFGSVDGVISLVGGWRGGGGLAAQTEDDYRALEASFTAIRVTSRAFADALHDSEAGRFAIVSSTAVARPLAGGANYAAVKAASEAWTRAVAHGFAKAARDAEEPLHAAAVIFRVKTLDPEALAAAFVGLWNADVSEITDHIIELD